MLEIFTLRENIAVFCPFLQSLCHHQPCMRIINKLYENFIDLFLNSNDT